MTTFTEATKAYLSATDAGLRDGQRLKKICDARVDGKPFGSFAVEKIVPMHASAIANLLHPGTKGQTRNREVVVPINAVLGFATDNNLGLSRRMKRTKETKVLPRRPAAGVTDQLIAAADGMQRIFLMVITYQGWRISETLGLQWPNVDLDRASFVLYIGKARTEKLIAMHPKVQAVLTALPQTNGAVFPWTDRRQVYSWLTPMCARLGIRFTPHMGRHQFASELNEKAGATPFDLCAVSTWTNPRSPAHYISATDGHARGLLAKL